MKNTLIAELIWLAGAATDVCPGRQTPSRRHCFRTWCGRFWLSSVQWARRVGADKRR